MMDIVFIIAFVSVLIVSVFIVALVLVEFDANWPFTGESKTVLEKGVQAIYIFDQMIIVYALGISMFSIVSAFFIRSHPVFFVFSVLLLALAIFFSAQMANAINAFMLQEPFAAIVNNFPMALTLVRNFPLFSLLIGVLIAIATYAKGEETSGINA